MPADHAPTDDTVLRQPAAPISPQEIAEMRNAFRRTTPGRWNWWTSSSMYRLSTTHDGKDGGVLHAFIAKDGVPDISMSEADRAFVEMAHERFPALLDAIEALTAENARLTSERDAIKDGFAELLSKYFADFGQVYQPEHYATTDHGWYALHRSKVEADHAAAVQAKRDARRAEGDAALSAVAMRDLVDAAGIDMDLLGKLCREEPDEATKREVEAMMDGLNKDGD